jgi:hypothetical protein
MMLMLGATELDLKENRLAKSEGKLNFSAPVRCQAVACRNDEILRYSKYNKTEDIANAHNAWNAFI